MAVISNHAGVAIAALIFAGSLLGFLPFNLTPARIYLGDAGSMLIGLIVGGLSIRASIKGPGTMLLAAPLALLTIPILDSTAAILRRKLAGRSIYETDRGHLHHRLLERFGNKDMVLVCVASCAGLTGAAALIGTLLKSDLIALVAVAAVVLMLVTTGLFGRGEFGLLVKRAWEIALSHFRPIDPRSSTSPRDHRSLSGLAAMGCAVGHAHRVGGKDAAYQDQFGLERSLHCGELPRELEQQWSR